MRPAHPFQRGLQFMNGVLFLPSSGTDGAGRGLGAAWATGSATISHPTPGATFGTQLKRTKYALVSATNQELGPRLAAASDFQFWMGNGVNLGGWYFSATFGIEAWAADTGRLFVGLSGTNTAVCTSDTVANHTIGLWHDTTEGQDVLSLVTKATTTTTKLILTSFAGGTAVGYSGTAVAASALAPGGLLAAGSTMRFDMWAFPNSVSTINTNLRLSWFDNTNNVVTKLVWNAQGGGPSTSTLCAPQCQMSNGTADTTAGHYAISVANIYVEPYSGQYE